MRWSLDFVSDALADGRRFRVLAIVDDFPCECLALVVDTSRVAGELHAVTARRDKPHLVVSDNGPFWQQLGVHFAKGMQTHGGRSGLNVRQFGVALMCSHPCYSCSGPLRVNMNV